MANINGYIASYLPSHPRATSNGMVYDHILEAEKMLGRYLTDKEVVHHKDQKRNNNNTENLLVFRTQSDHVAFHAGKPFYLNDEGVAYVKDEDKGTYCTDCGKLISNGAIRCKECRDIAQQKTVRPTKDDLKSLIRNNSFVSLGKQFCVSDNAVRKWCQIYNLPYKSSDIKLISDDDWAEI